MRAYDESYLNDAMNALGEMLDYAVVDCGRDPDEFFDWFIVSGIAAQFERGNPKFVAGMSGAEIAREVIFRVTGNRETRPATQSLDRSPEYWAGWILAYYQWYRNLRFAAIAEGGLPPSAVIERYILHEADVSKFVETADEVLGGAASTAYASCAHSRQPRHDATGAGTRIRCFSAHDPAVRAAAQRPFESLRQRGDRLGPRSRLLRGGFGGEGIS